MVGLVAVGSAAQLLPHETVAEAMVRQLTSGASTLDLQPFARQRL